MLSEIAAFAPMPPLAAALLIGAGMATGRLGGDPGTGHAPHYRIVAGDEAERLTAQVVMTAVLISSVLVVLAIVGRLSGAVTEHVMLGTWLRSGDYHIRLNFDFGRPGLTLAGLTALMAPLVLQFSIDYLHRDRGFHRFFAVLSLFTGAMLLLALAGNAGLTFIGWELAGLSSYLLIAYDFSRPVATANANRAFVTNRVGDAGFVLGIVLALMWTGDIDWTTVNAAHLQEWQASTLAGCFLLAAIAKSAQVPLAPWLAGAMEGPTSSSAIFYGSIMVHAGVFLMIKLAPLLEHAPLIMVWMAAVGLITALFGYFCGLVQTDIKSALIYATTTQVGLMFFEAGLGYWEIARWHLCAHAVFRGYQFLVSPSVINQMLEVPTQPMPAIMARFRWLYMAAFERFWLESFTDWLVVKPIHRLGTDLQTFDHQFVDKSFGLDDATFGGLSSLADLDKHGRPARGSSDVTQVSGLPGLIVRRIARSLNWFENRLVLEGVSIKMIGFGKEVGARMNHIEGLLCETRFLVLFIVGTFLAVF